MPQLDTTYFVSQIFWLSVFFAFFYRSLKYFVIPKIESVIKDRIAIKESSEKIKEELAEQIRVMKQNHKDRAEELRMMIKDLQIEANEKFEKFSKKSIDDLQNKLDKKMKLAEEEVEKIKEGAKNSKEYSDLVIALAGKVIFKMTALDSDKSKLKKLAS